MKLGPPQSVPDTESYFLSLGVKLTDQSARCTVQSRVSLSLHGVMLHLARELHTFLGTRAMVSKRSRKICLLRWATHFTAVLTPIQVLSDVTYGLSAECPKRGPQTVWCPTIHTSATRQLCISQTRHMVTGNLTDLPVQLLPSNVAL